MSLRWFLKLNVFLTILILLILLSLRHSNCPNCRNVFLPVDEESRRISRARHRQLAIERTERMALTYVCGTNGLVCLPHDRGEKGLLTCNAAHRQLSCSNMKRSELAKMRGGRIDEGLNDNSSKEEEDEMAISLENEV